MAKETFNRVSSKEKRRVGRIFLIGSIKKALGLKLNKEDWPIINEEGWGF